MADSWSLLTDRSQGLEDEKEREKKNIDKRATARNE